MADLTLLDRVEEAAASGGGRVTFHGDGEPVSVRAPELYEMARVRAGRLRDAGVGIGRRIGIVGPNAPDWVAWAYATWMVGAAYVPIGIPLRLRDREAVAQAMVTLLDGFDCLAAVAHPRYGELLDPARVISWDDLDSTTGPLEPSAFTRAPADAIARIIPTSGTTATPRGVGRAYGDHTAVSMARAVNPLGLEEVRYLTYAPMAHSAGLMATMAPLNEWLVMHMLAPERFARDPASLFRLVGEHKIMMLPAASSAIAAALRAVERRGDTVDLSSLTRLTFSFERVDPAVVDRLLEWGGRHGLRPEAVAAQYGLTEGGATSTAPGAGIRIDEVDLESLVTDGVARPPVEGRPTKRIASSGRPYMAELRIMGPDGPLPDRHVGEAQFRGGPNLQGRYVENDVAIEYGPDGWLSTGDLAYLDDGELFVTGRLKEVIVQRGKNYHPDDIEWAIARALDVSTDRCLAFALDDGRESIVVAVEIDGDTLGHTDATVRAAVMNALGLTLHAVVPVARDSLPKTASGKLQRLAARDAYLSGSLVPADR